MIDLNDYDLYLFDFDGLLVDTEFLHYKAYERVTQECGLSHFWDYPTYCRYAHLGLHGEAIYRDFPELTAHEAEWEGLRRRKMVHYKEILKSTPIDLMPGVLSLLQTLHALKKTACVVTNSYRDDVVAIRSQIPELNLIPHWLTREDYEMSKPSPSGYLKAISLYGKEGGSAIGFEDTVKGLTALHLAGAHPVLVCADDHPQLKEPIDFPFSHTPSLTSAYSH
jgi:HAD superfamily hydrolase (TIGR01509 family)